MDSRGAARVVVWLMLLLVINVEAELDDGIVRTLAGCAYRHPVSCSKPHIQAFLDAWAEKTRCWLCDNGPMVSTASVLIQEIFNNNIGVTGNREITQAWLETCLSAYALALFTTSRSTKVQTWRFYEFGMNLLWSCKFDDGIFFDHYGVTAAQLHYVFFLLSYSTPLNAHGIVVQVSEHQRWQQFAASSTALIPSPPWSLPLVVDVGMGLGADTRYYLSQGFRAVSIEANPRSVQTAIGDLFTIPYIASGQMTFLHAAVAPPGKVGSTMPFYQFSTRPEQSNAEHWMKEAGAQPIQVRTLECADVLRVHGRPVYMKVDIESNSINCLESLHKMHIKGLRDMGNDYVSMLPDFISMEVEAPGIVPHFQALLIDMGYDAYKVCRQYIYSPAPCEQGSYGQEIPGCGSGPFGESAVDYIRGKQWSDIIHMHNDTGWVNEFLNGFDWFDIHAKLDRTAERFEAGRIDQ